MDDVIKMTSLRPGRWTSSEPNVQQIARELFNVDEDNPFLPELDYGNIEKIIAAQHIATAEKATESKIDNKYYKLTEEEQVSVAIVSGCKFDTKGSSNSINFIVENVSIVWDEVAKGFRVAQRVEKK